MKPQSSRHESGFSLTELLVAVSLLLLLAAIVFPRVTHSRLAADEASAMQSLREVHRAQSQYASRHPDLGFSSNLAELSAGSNPTEGFDPNLAAGHKSGYLFIYTPGAHINGYIKTYSIVAIPEKVGDSGQRRFFSDESGDIRYNASGPADASSPVIQ